MNAGKAASADASALPMLANHCENHIKRLFPMYWGAGALGGSDGGQLAWPCRNTPYERKHRSGC